MILAVANALAGRTLTLDDACDRLELSFPDALFFAADPCDCGLPNCMGLSYGIVGLPGRHVDACGIGRGTQHVLLRFDPAEDDPGEGVRGLGRRLFAAAMRFVGG